MESFITFTFSTGFSTSFTFQVLSLRILNGMVALRSLLEEPKDRRYFPFAVSHCELFSSNEAIS